MTFAGVGLFHPAARHTLTPQVSRGLKVLGGVAVGQMSLGIATLLNYVPIGLAAVHQLGSLVVLSTGIFVVHSLRYVSPGVLRIVGKQIVTKTSGAAGAPSTAFATAGKPAAVAMKAIK